MIIMNIFLLLFSVGFWVYYNIYRFLYVLICAIIGKKPKERLFWKIMKQPIPPMPVYIRN